MKQSRPHLFLRCVLYTHIVFLFLIGFLVISAPSWQQIKAGEGAYPADVSGILNPIKPDPVFVQPAECDGGKCAIAVSAPVDPVTLTYINPNVGDLITIPTGPDIEWRVIAVVNGIMYLEPAGAIGSQQAGGGGGIYPPSDPQPPDIPPPGTGTLNALAIAAPASAIDTCTKLVEIKTCLEGGGSCTGQYLNGTKFYLNSIVGPNTQTDGTGVNFTNLTTAYTWHLGAIPPSTSYSPYISCRKTTVDPVYKMWYSVYMQENMTADFIVGFGPLFPWMQVMGGGNTFADVIYSQMPLSLAPALLFDTSPATQNGIVSVSTGMDLSDAPGSSGLTNISHTNWNTDNGMTQRDWYSFYSHRLNQATILPYTDFGAKPTWITPSAGDLPYKVYTTKGETIGGNLVISHPWVIGENERIVIIVDGSLEIQYPITLTNPNTGFVGFVVKDDITIDPTVGTTWNSTTPVVEGMYIAGGSIKTGTSTSAGTERFVGRGMFAATNILTQRNLYSLGHNIDTSADLFLYNPAFLVTMPGVLKDLTIEWQEVAP